MYRFRFSLTLFELQQPVLILKSIEASIFVNIACISSMTTKALNLCCLNIELKHFNEDDLKITSRILMLFSISQGIRYYCEDNYCHEITAWYYQHHVVLNQVTIIWNPASFIDTCTLDQNLLGLVYRKSSKISSLEITLG